MSVPTHSARGSFIAGLVFLAVAWSGNSWATESFIATFPFTTDTGGWSFQEVSPAFTPPLAAHSDSDGGLALAATNNTSTFGWWESPVITVTPGTLLAADFTLRSDQSDPTRVPGIRLRATSTNVERRDLPTNSQQTDLLTLDSNPPATFSPVLSPRTVTTYWYASPAAASLGLEFDLVNVDPGDAATGTVVLAQVILRTVDEAAFSGGQTERDYTFDSGPEGFTFSSLPELFTAPSPGYDAANGQLSMQLVPVTTGDFEFSWWGSPEDATAVQPQEGRLYLVDFTVESDQEAASQVPGFRLRVNESRFQASKQVVIASTGNGADSPTLGHPRTYTVVFPSGAGVGGHLIASFDFFAGALDGDAAGAHLYLKEVRVRSVEEPLAESRRILLPGDVPLDLVRIPAGEFQMGSTDEWSYSSEQPVHLVAFAHPFYMGKYEVTQQQWQAIMGTNPSYFTGDTSRPVDQLDWDTSKAFVAALNAHIQATGQGPANLRLPSEAEWEYSCRAGSTTRFYFGNSTCNAEDCNACDLGDHGWTCSSSGAQTHPVGAQDHANPWGLFDMYGNVYEWCEDRYHDYYFNAPADGSAWVDGDSHERIIRGGSWSTTPRFCRSAQRYAGHPSLANANVGVRLAANGH